MQKLLIAIYFLIVAAISITAKAQDGRQINVPVQYYNFSRDSLVIEVAGFLPNPCVEALAPSLEITKDDNTLMLKVNGTVQGDFCIATVGGPFEMAIDPRSLKFELQQRGLDPEATYRIISEDLVLDQTIDFSEIGISVPFSSASMVGLISADSAQPALTTENGGKMIVSSPFINFSELNGKVVTVFGHAVTNQIAGRNFGLSKKSEPTFLVTGLSVAAD